MDVSLEIPSTFEQGTDGDFYKEYLSDKNKDRTMLCYVEDDDYEKLRVVINRVVNEGLTTDDL